MSISNEYVNRLQIIYDQVEIARGGDRIVLSLHTYKLYAHAVCNRNLLSIQMLSILLAMAE